VSERDLAPPCAHCSLSTGISAPLMNEDSSGMINTTSGATSSTIPGRSSSVAALFASGNAVDALGWFVAAALPVGMQAVDRVVHGTQAGVHVLVHLAKEGII
jgi:hypothetical protein